MNPSEFKISISDESYDKKRIVSKPSKVSIQNFPSSQKLWRKNCWKLPKFLRCWKAHNQKLSNISKSKLSNISIQILISQIKDLNKDCAKMLRPYLLNFPRNDSSKSIIVAAGRFIVLNDSASPKMVKKINLIFFKGLRTVWMSSRRPIYDW